MTLLRELEKLEILDSPMLMSSSVASPMPLPDVVRVGFFLRPKSLCHHVGEFVNGRSVGGDSGLVSGCHWTTRMQALG
jgi:hypothetical protein